jgi:class 3 adenylate cyclase
LTSTDPQILVVDDNDDNRFTLIRRLKRSGYSAIEVATNGREALSLLESRPFDLILLDIMMPEMDGFQVLEHLKKDMQLRSVVTCIELGAEDYLHKPFNPTLLKARIGACLEKKRLRDMEASYLRRIKEEQKRSDDLLKAILPAAAVQELKATGEVKPRRYEGVAILFCDIVGFTSFCDQHLPERVVSHLQGLVDVFEDIVHNHQMEKIKTIGDAFMATAGLLRPLDAPLLTAVKCGLDMAAAAARVEPKWDVRTGVHFGPVVAGVVGNQQFLFDVWGDTVNVAARLVDHGSPGSITMTHSAWQEIQEECRARSIGVIEIKGKGPIEVIECLSVH